MFPLNNLRRIAGNLKGGKNPPFTINDFKNIYPQFWNGSDEFLVPSTVMEMYFEFADASVKESRYHSAWKYATSLFIAHFLTLYLQTTVNATVAELAGPANAVISAGAAKGLQASKTVDGVSVSYDFSQAMSDLDGWANWKLTAFGTQFATLAKSYSKGGMYVW